MTAAGDSEERDLLGIGELARASGLTVSALRFYDREGVLVPAAVDTGTGYRRYGAAQVRPARLVAGMRRIGVPLSDMVVALEHLARHGGTPTGAGGDLDSVRGILADHLARLEEGVADARREVARLGVMLEETPGSATGEWRLDGAGLVEALRAVRFAVGADPEFPSLHGVLVEVDGEECRVVATDRYRLAVSATPVTTATGPAPARVVAPTVWVDEVLRAAPSGPARLMVTATTVTLESGAGEVCAELVTSDYPDHERVVEHLDVAAAATDASTLARRVRATTPLHTGDDGEPLVVLGTRGDTVTVDEQAGVAVRRAFLLEALDAAGEAPALRLDGDISPLVVRRDDTTWSVLMPVRRPA